SIAMERFYTQRATDSRISKIAHQLQRSPCLTLLRYRSNSRPRASFYFRSRASCDLMMTFGNTYQSYQTIRRSEAKEFRYFTSWTTQAVCATMAICFQWQELTMMT